MTVDKNVTTAVELGWLVAELYAPLRHGPAPEEVAHPAPPPAAAPLHNPRPTLPPDLPGRDDLHAAEKRALQQSQITVALTTLGPVVTAAGLSLPPTPDLGALLAGATAEARYEAGLAILDFHAELLSDLVATDVRLGDAYGLGRALADVTLRLDPKKATLAGLRSDLNSGRVRTLHDRLSTLKTALPDHAGGGVIASLEAWSTWAAASPPAWRGAPVVDGPAAADGPSTPPRDVVLGLRRQGRLWREVLTGEKAPLDHLQADDYVEAGGNLIGQLRNILKQVLRQYVWFLLAAVAAVVVVVGLAVGLFANDVAKVTGALVALLGGLGITTKSLSTAFTRVVDQGESYLWGAELDLAVGRAITVAPDVAAQVSGEPPANRFVRQAEARVAASHLATYQTAQAHAAAGSAEVAA